MLLFIHYINGKHKLANVHKLHLQMVMRINASWHKKLASGIYDIYDVISNRDSLYSRFLLL